MHKLLGALFAALLVTSAPAYAEDLLAAYRAALESDPVLRQAYAGLAATREQERQSKGGLLPSLTLSGSISENRQKISGSGTVDFSDDGYALTLTQPLVRRDLNLALDQARSGTAQSEADLRAALQALAVRVAERYFDVLAASDNLRFAEAEKKAIARQLDQTRQRFEVGLIAITDVHEAQARHDQAVSQEIVARNEFDSAREALREVTGHYVSEVAPFKGEIPLNEPNPDSLEGWTALADEHNPTLQAARLSAQNARQEIARRRAGHLPTLDAVARYSYSDTGGGFFGTREITDTSVSLELTLPLYQGGQTEAGRRQALHLSEKATQALEAQRRTTDRQVRDAFRGILASISQVKALNQAVRSSKSAQDATQAGFEVGTRTIVDVLDTQRDLFRARRDHARARYDYALNTLRLKQAAGTLADEDIARINLWLKS